LLRGDEGLNIVPLAFAIMQRFEIIKYPESVAATIAFAVKVSKLAEKQKYSFKCLEQGCSNRVCCSRDHVNVTFADLARWTEQDFLGHIIRGLTLSVTEGDDGDVSLETLRKPLSKDLEKTSCIFFHEESNACSIRFGRPISCRTYPLTFTGEKFVVASKACEGIGKGETTKEILQEQRNLAEQEHKERIETATALPAIYAIVMAQMIKQSADAMSRLSEEDRKKVDDIMSKGAHEEDHGADEDSH